MAWEEWAMKKMSQERIEEDGEIGSSDVSRSQKLPALRSDLEIVRRPDVDGDRLTVSYVIRKPSSDKTFELREEDYFICEQLDGRTSLAEVQSEFKTRFNLDLDIEQLEAFIRQLEEMGFLAGGAPKSSFISSLLEPGSPETWQKWNLFDPDRPLTWLADSLRWCYTPAFVAVSAVLLLLAVAVLCNNFSEFLRDFKLFFVPLSLVQALAVFYFFFNIPTRIARGITSTHYGGRADEFGIQLAWDVLPTSYCNNRLEEIGEKSGRSWTLFSPVHYALLAASLGMLCWRMTWPGVSLHTLGIALVVIGTIFAVVRLNILWPTDASNLLSNWLEIPDFRKRALAVAKTWFFHRPPPEPLTAKEKRLFRWYGVLAATVTWLSIGAGAYFLSKWLIYRLNGGGALILLFAVALKSRRGISAWFRQRKVAQRTSVKGKSLMVHVKRVIRLLLIAVLVVLMFVPYPYKSRGPIKILPIKRIEVRAQVPGEITEVLVKEGDWVKEGQPLALLDTRDHQKNLDVTRAQLDKAKADLRLLEAGPKTEEIEKARQQVITAQTRYDYSSREAERLKAMYEEGGISEEEYTRTAGVADVDAKTLEVAKAHLELVKSGPLPEEIEAQKAVVRDLETRARYYQEDVSLAKLIAPIPGQITTPYMETKVGQILKRGDLLAVILDARTVQIEIQIPEADINEVKVGARIEVKMWTDPTKSFYGRVFSIAPHAENTEYGRTVRVLTEIPNPGLELRPDMTGEAKIQGTSRPVIVAFTRMIVRFVMVEVWSWFP
jgi:multidrug resistance efflux pump